MDTIISAPPKSLQTANLIKAEIERLAIKPGDRILTARQFAERLLVSKQVVQSAFALLEKDGVIETRSRHGTFVSTPQRAHVLGMLLHAKADAFALLLVKALNESAAKLGVKMRIGNFASIDRDALKAATALAEDGAKALIIPWLPAEEQGAGAQRFAGKCPVPPVIMPMIEGLEKHCPEATSLAGLGNASMTEAACRYLSATGVGRLALIGPDREDLMARNLRAYSDFVRERGLPPLVRQTGCGDAEMAETASLWRAFKGDLGIICYDDVYAMKLMFALMKIGMVAPRDFRIIGRNDMPQAAAFEPPLTTFRVNYANLGDIAVKCALAAVKGEEWHSAEPAPNVLAVRESCGCRRRVAESLAKALAPLGVIVEADGTAPDAG